MISNSWVVRGNLHPSWHFHVEDTPTTSSLSTPTHGKCCQAACSSTCSLPIRQWRVCSTQHSPFRRTTREIVFYLFHVKKEHPCCHPAPPSCSFSKPSCDENSSFFVVVFFNFTWKSSQLGRGLVRKKRSRKQFKCVTKLKLLEPQWTRFSSSLFPPVWVSNSTYVDVRARAFIRNFGLIWILGHDKIKHVLTFITYLVTYSYK